MTQVRHSPLDAETREALCRLLTRVVGRPVTVLTEEPLGHDWAPTTRLTLDTPVFDGATTVVVKTARHDGGEHGTPRYVRREIAGLRSAEGCGAAPRVIGADDAHHWLVQSDVGPAPTLQDVLLGADPVAAAAGMVAMAQVVARLHAHTTDRLGWYRSLPDLTNAASGVVYLDATAEWTQVQQACVALDLPEPTATAREVEALSVRIRDGGNDVLVHRDLNPGNVIITPDGARLVDFEGSWPGPAGIDAAFLAYPFPHHGSPWGTVSSDVRAAALAAYRDELTNCGADALASQHEASLLDGAATTLIWRLCRLRKVADDDQHPTERWRRRGQILNQATTFLHLADGSRTWAAFTDWIGQLLEVLRRRWPEEADRPAPLFPAFGSTVTSG